MRKQTVLNRAAVCLLTALVCLWSKNSLGQSIKGTLSNTNTSTSTSKPQNGGTCTTTTTTYIWTFKDSSGAAHKFSGNSQLIYETYEGGNITGHGPRPEDGGCNLTETTSLDEFSTDNEYYLQATGSSGSITGEQSFLQPAYQVTSILYDAPGNKSSDGYTNSTTDGSSSSISSSFKGGNSVTYTTGSWLTGGSLSFGFSASATTGNMDAFTESFSDAEGVSLVNAGGANAINHNQDLFLVWLNPQVSVVSDGSDVQSFGITTQSNSSSELERTDIVEVTASTMEANSAGASTVQPSILNFQIDSEGEKLPGLASICAKLNSQEYEAGNCTLANQCGCTPADFKPILALDPLLSYSGTANPMNADTSGATACSNPTSADKCRYIPVPSSPNGGEQAVATLSGPECSGCSTPVNTFTQSDANTKTQTFSESTDQTVSFTATVDFLVGDFSSSDSFTWTQAESAGSSTGTANTQTVTLSSTQVGCYEDVSIFEDTVFHTFVFQQPSGNTSCNP